MSKTARVCGRTDCPEIVTGANYCDTHKPVAWETSTRNRKNPPGWARTRASVLWRANATCAYCGGEATEVDHVIPLTRGGTHNRSNLVAACSTCNRNKNYAERVGRTWTPPSQTSS